jgi:hypothetical protein
VLSSSTPPEQRGSTSRVTTELDEQAKPRTACCAACVPPLSDRSTVLCDRSTHPLNLPISSDRETRGTRSLFAELVSHDEKLETDLSQGGTVWLQA